MFGLNNQTYALTEQNECYRVAYGGGLNDEKKEFTKELKLKGQVKKLTLSKSSATVILEDNTIWKLNKVHDYQKSSKTGKYYCGAKLGFEYGDGFCGPTNGMNCILCQELDRKEKNLGDE